MNPFGIRLRGNQEEEVKAEPQKNEHLEILKGLCGSDTALYEDLKWSLRDPEPNGKETYEESMAKAADSERKGKGFNARVYLKQAGALALYLNKAEQVREAFSNLSEYKRINELISQDPDELFRVVNGFYKAIRPVPKARGVSLVK